MRWTRMRGAKLWKSAFSPAPWFPPTLPPEQQPLSCASFLFPKLQLGRSGVSNFNHMYLKKKIKRSLFGFHSHIFKSSVCASDLKRIENRGSGEKKKKKTKLSFEDVWTSTDSKNTESNSPERRIETIHSPQHNTQMGRQESVQNVHFALTRMATIVTPDPFCSTASLKQPWASASARESRKAHEIISPRLNSRPKIGAHVEVLV